MRNTSTVVFDLETTEIPKEGVETGRKPVEPVVVKTCSLCINYTYCLDLDRAWPQKYCESFREI